MTRSGLSIIFSKACWNSSVSTRLSVMPDSAKPIRMSLRNWRWVLQGWNTVHSFSRLDSLTEPLFVQTALEGVETGHIITGLSRVVYTFYIEAILRFI